MAVFFVLPPRAVLGECFARYLGQLFPGLQWEPSAWPELADVLTGITQSRPAVYLVHREELPAGEAVEQALLDGFGVEPGDEIIEVHARVNSRELSARHGRVGTAA